jgi:hypothetical protein
MMVFGMHGQKDDFRFGRGLQDNSSRINAIQQGHGEIEQGDVGAEFLGQPDRFSAIRSFTNHGEAFPL